MKRWPTWNGYKTAEAHLWEVCQRGESEEEINVIGHVAVYVDDLMVVAEKEVAKDIMKELGRTFKMAEPEEVTLEKEVTLCGYHIKKTKEGYALHQGKYIEELVKKHDIRKKEVIPCNRIADEPDEENPSKEDVRHRS